MGRKPKVGGPMSSAERNAKWYADPENAYHANRSAHLRRIASGTVPQRVSMERYQITRELINDIRKENGLPVFYHDRQITQERGLNQKNKGGTVTYVQAVPIADPVPEKPMFAPPSVAIQNQVKFGTSGLARAGGRKSKVPRAGGSDADDEDETDDDDDDGAEVEYSGEMHEFDSPFNLGALQECIEKHHPPTRKVTQEGVRVEVPYAEKTIAKNIIDPGNTIRWWAKQIGVPISEEEDINVWLDDNIEAMRKRALKITYKDFPKQDPLMNVSMAVKKRWTPLSGAMLKYCQSWGAYMHLKYRKTAELIKSAGAEFRSKQTAEHMAKQEKKVALPWQPVADRAKEALADPPLPSADLQTHFDHILLILWAGGKDGGHPLRDDTGNVKIISNASQVDKARDVHTQFTPEGDVIPIHDYYITAGKGRFIWRSHKTRVNTKDVIQNTTREQHNAIMNSLASPKNKRNWLFTKPGDLSQPYGKGISNMLKRPNVLGMGVNPARHSFISWWRKLKHRTPIEKKELGEAMMSSKEEQDDYEWFGEAPKKAPPKKAAPKKATPKKAAPKYPFGKNQVIPNKQPTPKREGLRERK